MDEGLVQPGLELDADSVGVLDWLTHRANRRSRVVPGDWLEITDRIARERNLSTKKVSDALWWLLDKGWVGKLDQGEGFRVLVSQDFFVQVSAARRSRALQRANLAPQALGWRAAIRRGGEQSEPERPPSPLVVLKRERSAQEYGGTRRLSEPTPDYPYSPVVKLARDTFPRLCEEHGIRIPPFQKKWMALAKWINRMRDGGMDLAFITEMMEEFARQPQWCSRSGNPPWQVFVSHRDELASLVMTRRRRDPGNRRHGSGAEYWLRRS